MNDGPATRVHLDIRDGKVKASVATGVTRVMPVGTCDEQDLIEEISKLSTPATGLLPASVLWISPTGRQVVVQRPPRRTLVQYTQGTVAQINAKTENLKSFSLEMPLPWMVYGFTFDALYRLREARIYVAYSQVTAMNATLAYLPMPNIYNDCRFCLPDASPEDWEPAPDLATAIMNAYNQIWSSNFNLDLMDLPTSALHNGYPHIFAQPRPNRVTKASVTQMLQRWSELDLATVAAPQGSGWEWHHWGNIHQLINLLIQSNNQSYNPHWLTSVINQGVQTRKN